ncbi:MAG: glutathione peroxidase [Polaribacter sp.]
MGKSIHQFTVKNLANQEVSLSQYEGKVLMIVNTASKCGFTPQLKDLEQLYDTYRKQGFEVLAFPSNEFGGQEPLKGEAIESFCQVNYGVSFTIFEKTKVKGTEASELYQFLANKKLNGAVQSVPKWNFHKYLVNKKGEVIDYYYSTTSPTANRVKRKIEGLLAE